LWPGSQVVSSFVLIRSPHLWQPAPATLQATTPAQPCAAYVNPGFFGLVNDTRYGNSFASTRPRTR
ncbi:MAG: hypothetical protein ACRD1G_02065, partial [Acidimicrobiales bacterium]